MLEELDKQGIKTTITDVGDKYVVKALMDNGYSVGGEASGHIIMPDLLKTGDGTLIALYIMKIIEKQSFQELTNDIFYYPETLTNLRVKDKYVYKREEIVNRINEIKKTLGKNCKIFMRASGTEDLLRITVSAKSNEDVLKYTKELKDLVLLYTEEK